MTIVKKAVLLALNAHKDQKYDGRTYFHGHLLKVASIGKRFTSDEELIAGCFLHDTIEDTNVTLAEIRITFGDRVATMVFAVTDGEGSNRKERKIESYKKLAVCSDGRFVKLCDRIANMQASEKNLRFADMYLKESKEFVEKLKVEGEHKGLWELYFKTESELASLVNIKD